MGVIFVFLLALGTSPIMTISQRWQEWPSHDLGPSSQHPWVNLTWCCECCEPRDGLENLHFVITAVLWRSGALGARSLPGCHESDRPGLCIQGSQTCLSAQIYLLIGCSDDWLVIVGPAHSGHAGALEWFQGHLAMAAFPRWLERSRRASLWSSACWC